MTSLELEALNVFSAKAPEHPIVEQVSMRLTPGEVLGLIGGSGSGKSLTALSLLDLLPAGLSATGRLQLDGLSLDLADKKQLRALRGRRIGIIFQDPKAALNPVRSIGAHFTEVLGPAGFRSQRARREEAVRLLQLVGVGNAHKRLSQYAHELSGGLCQRVMIALAIASRPSLLIADEPTTALDTTVQAQVLDLIDHMRIQEGMAVLFISHDLAVVADIADRIAVMHRGRIIETAHWERLIANPRSSYARQLVGNVDPVLSSSGLVGRHA